MASGKIEKLQEKKDQIEAQIRELKSKEKAKLRKLETRKKIIVGGAFLAVAAKQDKFSSKDVWDYLDSTVKRKNERALLGLPPKN